MPLSRRNPRAYRSSLELEAKTKRSIGVTESAKDTRCHTSYIYVPITCVNLTIHRHTLHSSTCFYYVLYTCLIRSRTNHTCTGTVSHCNHLRRMRVAGIRNRFHASPKHVLTALAHDAQHRYATETLLFVEGGAAGTSRINEQHTQNSIQQRYNADTHSALPISAVHKSAATTTNDQRSLCGLIASTHTKKSERSQ